MKIKAEHIKILLLFCMVNLIKSCSPDPSIEQLESYYMRFNSETVKRMLPGDKNNVVLAVIDNLNNSSDSVRVDFEIVSGGGSLSTTSVFADNNKTAGTEWTIGSESSKSILRAFIYKSDGKYLTFRDLIITCFIPGTWIEVSDTPDGGITDMVSDTIDHLTFMTSGGALYRQGSRYYQWEKVNDPVLETPRTVEMDNNRTIYVSTWSGNIVKSTDHGASWIRCTKPYPEDPYYICMSISNDNYIWAGKYDYPVRFSKDGGITWQNASSTLPSFLNGNTFRLKNGTLVNHGTNGTSRNRLNISTDDGATWISRETPGYSTGIYVTEKDEIFIITQNGFTICQTTDLGLTYKTVLNVMPEWGTTTENNNIMKWHGLYYVIVPGYGILRSPDLIKYENFHMNSDFRDLFIDSNGVMVAKDKDSNSVYYFKEKG